MTTPEKSAIDQAFAELDSIDHQAELDERRYEAIIPLDEAVESIDPRFDIELPGYAETPDGKLNIRVRLDNSKMGHGKRTGTYKILIEGQLQRLGGGESKPFKMYEIGRNIRDSDNQLLGRHPARFSVDRANGEHLLLAQERGQLDRHDESAYSFATATSPSPEQIDEVRKTGLYLDPRGEEMMAEVYDILDQALNSGTQTNQAA